MINMPQHVIGHIRWLLYLEELAVYLLWIKYRI